MIPDFFGWYLGSVADFWANVLTIRIPHLLILFLIIWWVFGKEKRRHRYGWRWGCGCRCVCGKCCCGSAEDDDEYEWEEIDSDEE